MHQTTNYSFRTPKNDSLLASNTMIALLIGLLLGACGGPRVVRGSEDPRIDQAAFSTSLDKRDLQDMMRATLKHMWSAPVVTRWQSENKPAVAILAIRNETSEHIDSALQALISDFETELINSGHVRVVSLENQPRLMEEIKRQHSGGFDPNQVASWGRQLGVKYVVTGKVFSTAERADNASRVQYYLFSQIISVETSEIVFQHKAENTKAIVAD